MRVRTRFPRRFHAVLVIGLLLPLAIWSSGPRLSAQSTLHAAHADDPGPPTSPVKLVFVHHSTGEGWLSDSGGRLGIALRDNNYFVSDTNYGWGPDSIGDRTDIGHWWTWFVGPSRGVYTGALYQESGQWCEYSRLSSDPGGPNCIVMFKSCFPNSHLGGNPNDPPTVGANPLRDQSSDSEQMTVGNAKGIYNDLLSYFATRQDKLFAIITAPPQIANGTDAEHAANARAFNDWLVHQWLAGYPYSNVAVFDFFNVLTTNGGNPQASDLGWATGNHHRWRDGAVEYVHPVANDYSAYGSDPDDSHPTAAGGQKASGEFVPLLNVFYNRWRRAGGTITPVAATATPSPTPTRSRTPSPSPTRTPTSTRTTPAASPTPTRTQIPGVTSTGTATPTRTRTSGPSPTPGQFRIYLPIILKTFQQQAPPSPSATTPLQASETPTRPPASTVVIQRGTWGEVADAYIWQSEADYTGNWETLYTGCVGWGRKQTLLAFDLTPLGSSITLERATLCIAQREAAGPRGVSVHRILADWEEGSVTWRSFNASYDHSVIGSFSARDAGWKQVDVTNAVRGWLNGTIPNHGLLLDDPSAGTDENEEYYASECEQVGQRPKLEILLSEE